MDTAASPAAAELANSPIAAAILGTSLPSLDTGEGPFLPREPRTLKEAGLSEAQVENLVLKAVLNMDSASGRQIANQVRLPFAPVSGVLQSLKAQLLLMYRSAAGLNDFEYVLSDKGMDRARRLSEQCTYYGAAPVTLEDYIAGMNRQSVALEQPRMADIRRALSDMMLPEEAILQIGQAVNFGRGFFLYGAPGNGKTSVAERIVKSLGQYIWIPRTVSVTGEYIRLFDPSNHEEAPLEDEVENFGAPKHDGRWVRIKRPTIVVGGELTLAQLDITTNASTGINEAPLQMKSNGGALVIDDFGRQRVSTSELLNRWIVPLEKKHDYLCLPSGRQVQIPFEQLLVFATNLEPNDLVDEAFLRRIPYKIEVFDPSEADFRRLFALMAGQMGFKMVGRPVDHLLVEHFEKKHRDLRYCHARDLLVQARNYCEFTEQPLELTHELIDRVVLNYFAGL